MEDGRAGPILPGRWRECCRLKLAPGVGLARKGITCSFQFLLSLNKCLTEHLLSASSAGGGGGRGCNMVIKQGLQSPCKARFTVGLRV